MAFPSDIIRKDTRANQPNAASVGAGVLFHVSDEGVVERSDGTNWYLFATLGGGALSWTASISPAQITADTDDYAPTGGDSATVFRLSTDASRNLTGITGGSDGRILVIENVGANDLVLKNDVTSTAANRFLMDGDLTLGGDSAALFRYDGTDSRWRLISVGTAIGSGASAGVSVLNSDTTPNGTSTSTAETDLTTYAMPGGTLANDGDSVRVTASGTLAATTRNRTVRFYFGATALEAFASANASNIYWQVHATITRIDGTNQRTCISMSMGQSGAAAAIRQTTTDTTETLSGSVTIKTTGEVGGTPVANDIVCNLFLVEHLPV